MIDLLNVSLCFEPGRAQLQTPKFILLITIYCHLFISSLKQNTGIPYFIFLLRYYIFCRKNIS